MVAGVQMAAATGDPTSTAIEPYSKHMVRTSGQTKSQKKHLANYFQCLKSLRSGKRQEELCGNSKPARQQAA